MRRALGNGAEICGYHEVRRLASLSRNALISRNVSARFERRKRWSPSTIWLSKPGSRSASLDATALTWVIGNLVSCFPSTMRILRLFSGWVRSQAAERRRLKRNRRSDRAVAIRQSRKPAGPPAEIAMRHGLRTESDFLRFTSLNMSSRYCIVPSSQLTPHDGTRITAFGNSSFSARMCRTENCRQSRGGTRAPVYIGNILWIEREVVPLGRRLVARQ